MDTLVLYPISLSRIPDIILIPLLFSILIFNRLTARHSKNIAFIYFIASRRRSFEYAPVITEYSPQYSSRTVI